MNTSQIPLIILNTAGTICWIAIIIRNREHPGMVLLSVIGLLLSFGALIICVMKARGDIP